MRAAGRQLPAEFSPKCNRRETVLPGIPNKASLMTQFLFSSVKMAALELQLQFLKQSVTLSDIIHMK